jgi:ubiquinone/menaquinone biosynthesis C-methylase UbiE
MKTYLIDHSDENKRLDFQNKIDVYNLDRELDFFSLQKNDLILDAGCGTGNVIEKLLQLGHSRIHGLDFSEDRIRQSQERFSSYNDVQLFNRPMDKTEFSPSTYDVVFCRYIYEHVTNPKEILAELYRVIKPNGHIYLVNLDDIFFNFHTKNEFFNQQLKSLQDKLPQDFKIGRKLPLMLREQKFEQIEWEAQTYFFKGERLKLERENTRMRLEQGRCHLSKFFSSTSEYDDFAKTYLDEMQDDCNVLSLSKYLIKANKLNIKIA